MNDVSVNPTIFRKYDVRGIVGQDLTPEVVNLLGKGYGTYAARQGVKKISLGYDARLSSPEFCQALTAGIVSTGVDVVQIGLVATPTLYFSFFHLDLQGGVMITGSHNPPEFNGFKLGLGQTTIHGQAIQDVLGIIQSGDFARGKGQVALLDIGEAYIADVVGRVGQLARPLQVVVDAGNGAGGPFGPEMLRRIGAEVVELYCEVDGHFPNHHPDPTLPHALQALIAKVEETGADVGVAWDGDADRIGVVDAQGRIIWGDQLMMLFSREVLSKHPGAPIIFEVKCSQGLVDEIERLGGNPVMYKTGHSLIKTKMKEMHAPLAGEMSGHLFFADEYWGYDDALYATCRFVRLLAAQEKSLVELVDELPRYYSTPETRVDCPEDKKFEIVSQMAAYFKERYDAIDIDGVRILFGDGWGLLRASNTQPVLVLRFEAQSPQRLQAIQEIVVTKLREIAPEIRVSI
ncbi:MAG: phosphomannomutase/phosphoglucomutase [Anaerolineae bacterium]|nr:phosphomannomutase/phosphoglucomutase [Anaerolineae bacterium]